MANPLLEGIQAVTFDVGGTLIEPWPSVGHVYAEVARRHGCHSHSPEQLSSNFAAAWKAKSGFDYSKRAWADLVNSSFGFPAGEPAPFFGELYERFAQAYVWRIFDDVVPTLAELRRRGLKLGIISNWDDRLRPLLERLRLADMFDAVTVSCEIGATKPDRKIYHAAIAKFSLPANAVLHVGDSEWEDGSGASSAGLAAALIERKGHATTNRSVRVISRLDQLLVI